MGPQYQHKHLGPLEWVGGHWNGLGAIGMDRGPLECTGGNWNGYVPSTCIQALIFVTTFFRKSHQKSECLTQMTKHASKTIKFELLGAQTACGDCSNAIPTRPHIPSLGIPSLTSPTRFCNFLDFVWLLFGCFRASGGLLEACSGLENLAQDKRGNPIKEKPRDCAR